MDVGNKDVPCLDEQSLSAAQVCYDVAQCLWRLDEGPSLLSDGLNGPRSLNCHPRFVALACCEIASRAEAAPMSFYQHYFLPRLIDLAMRNKQTAHLRSTWIPRARGEVLEVGIGSGLNLAFYSSQVQRVYGVDPSVELQEMARKRLTGPIHVEFFSQSAEEPLPLANASIDTVVLTWTLCSIPDAPKALQQLKRVLRTNGRLIFLEHGRAPDSGVVAWQNRLTPIWKRIAGGCQLNRKIDELIKAAGFQIAELKTCYLPGPRPMTYTYQGVAHLG